MFGRISKCCICVISFFILTGGVLTRHEVRMKALPSWVRLSEKKESAVIHAESADEEIDIILKDGNLILYDKDILYQSDSEWIVADFFIVDIDSDGFDEILLHVWKKGSFGKYQPFWKKEENKTFYSEHLFFYKWDTERPDRLNPEWMSSEMPVKGKQISIENETVRILSPDGTETFWKWGNWGLFLADEIKK